METILWAQNESTDIQPTILVNGECVEGEIAQLAFSELNVANQTLTLSPDEREVIYNECLKKGLYCSRQANYSILDNGGGVYLQGCYINEDCVGRKMPFMFLCKGTDTLQVAYEKLEQLSAKLNRTCNQTEKKCMLRAQTRKSRKKKIFFFKIALIISIIIVCVILSLTN